VYASGSRYLEAGELYTFSGTLAEYKRKPHRPDPALQLQGLGRRASQKKDPPKRCVHPQSTRRAAGVYPAVGYKNSDKLTLTSLKNP